MSKPKRRCPACGSTNPADAASCCVCGFVFAAAVGSETAVVRPPEPPASKPDAAETPAGDGARTQRSTVTDWASPQARAGEAGASPKQRPDRAAAQRRRMISLTALLALAVISAIGLLAISVFRSVAEESAMPLSVRPTAATVPRSGIIGEARSAEPLTPTATPLPRRRPPKRPYPHQHLPRPRSLLQHRFPPPLK